MLANVLSTFNLGDNVTLESVEDGFFGHDEADITIISYVLHAAQSGKGVVRILCDDTDVFVLLVYWVFRKDLRCKVQMERWDGTIIVTNPTSVELGAKMSATTWDALTQWVRHYLISLRQRKN